MVPVFLKAEPRVLRDNLALSRSFAALGFGFMLVEIAQMQRLIVLLGHPTFSLSVVLFGLLISGGAGKASSMGARQGHDYRRSRGATSARSSSC